MPKKTWIDYLIAFLLGGFTKKRLEDAGAGEDAIGGAVTGSVDLPTGFDREADEMAKREAICQFMRENVGDPYTFGAEIDPEEDNPATGDCSEYTEHAYLRAGMHYPDGSWIQRDYCRNRIVMEPKPGDIFFFEPNKNGVGHTGIYMGDGSVVHAVGGRGMIVASRAKIEGHPRFAGWFRHPDFTWPESERG